MNKVLILLFAFCMMFPALAHAELENIAAPEFQGLKLESEIEGIDIEIAPAAGEYGSQHHADPYGNHADSDTAHDDHHGGKHAKSSAGLPQLDISKWPSQIFWLGLMFIVLYTVFSGKILPRIASNIENREQNIQANLDRAEKMTEEASNFQKSYEDGLQSARSDAAQIMTDMDIQMRAEQEKKQSAFLKKAEEKISEIKKNLDKATKASMNDIETHIEETALMAAKNVAGIDTDGKAVKAALKAVNSNIKVKAA